MSNTIILWVLCAALYLFIAVSYYRKLLAISELKKEIENELYGFDESHTAAVLKTAAMLVALFWPLSLVASRFIRGGK